MQDDLFQRCFRFWQFRMAVQHWAVRTMWRKSIKLRQITRYFELMASIGDPLL
jgi:hypothetical protein